MKQILTTRDLAINGAPPAFSEPIVVGKPHIGDREALLSLIDGILERRVLSNNGPLVQSLEQRIADYLGVRECVATCNGTIALEIAIRALGLSGEVIVPSYTFVATAHALHWQGISPVFADIDPVTQNLDPDAVRRAITARTTGILGVHLWGRSAPVKELQALADEYGLQLLFDAAHAFGCSYQSQMLGGFGRAEVLSFHATKFFNTFEGGAIVTNDVQLAETMRLMRNFGFAGVDEVTEAGTNGKMAEVCAAMGIVNLECLDRIVDTNRRNYHAYRDELSQESRLKILSYDESERNNFQYIVVELIGDTRAGRDAVVAALHAENVMARKYFWPGCHKMKPYTDLAPAAGLTLPVTEAVANRVIVLPTGGGISLADIQVIAAITKKALET